jgi:hypothetical protein
MLKSKQTVFKRPKFVAIVGSCTLRTSDTEGYRSISRKVLILSFLCII